MYREFMMQPPVENVSYAESHSFAGDLVELIKFRIAVMVTLSTLVGYVLGYCFHFRSVNKSTL